MPPSTTAPQPVSPSRLTGPAPHRERLGLGLGILGVAIFAATLPMTRLATGSAEAPQLSPWFATLGRAAIAGLLSALVLAATRAPLPARGQWLPLLLAALGNALLYPLLLSSALRTVTASHAAVITALAPLATAAAAAWLLRQRAGRAFWGWAVAGSALVIVFALLRNRDAGHGFAVGMADLMLVGAVAAASVGYVLGAQVTPSLGAERTICWITVLALPVTLPGMWWHWPTQPVAASAWGGFLYTALFSMWIGFFAWYRGLALGGALRVSQTLLLQPFFAIVFAALLLGEPIDLQTVGFAVAVVGTVLASRLSGKPP